MEFKGTKEEKALHYAENWEEITGLDYENMTPIEVSEIDYLNGYNQALEDSKYTEMLEMLKILIYDYKNYSQNILQDSHRLNRIKEIEQLIKEATEL